MGRPAAHTPLVDDHHPLRAIAQGGRYESPVGFVVGVALIACGALALAGAAVGAVSDQRLLGTFALFGIGFGSAGGGLIHLCRVPRRLRAATAFVGVVAVWVALIAASTVVYEIVDVFATVDDSLFESVAGFTTTASTMVDNPEGLSRAVLLWRAGTQWLGGLGALLFVVTILPSIGVGGVDVTDAGHRHRGASLRSRRTVVQLRRLSGLYAILTAVGVALYFLGGMGPFDAITYAATTISTGGFANHRGSFAHFDSTLLEWAGIGGMVLGGMNMALLFRGLRNSGGTFLRSMELKAYGGIIVLGSAAAALTNGNAIDHDGIRDALFHVTSAVSTTGFTLGGWADWDFGPQVMLLAMMGIGAMSGSAGSGFRLVRALMLVGFLKRELIVQLHPRAVVPVGVGHRVVHDSVVARIIGYQAQYLMLAATGAVAIATFGGELVTSIGAAISAIANVGPGLGDLAPGADGVRSLPRPARACMLPLMLLGRLEIAPVLVGASMAVSAVTGRIRWSRGSLRRWRSNRST